ncbi:MAG TPA: methyltransferase domain-containing protein, partial [Agitococcus sp.]|nr:methyltransferase domain-containing protein [Agitococcus sp.]
KENNMARKKVLNVGGNSKEIPLPDIYKDWDQVWLDIDPAVNPDVLCDARELNKLPANTYNAIYCSHNLEHYFRHDVKKVLAGFNHVLKKDGFAHIRVPDMAAVMRAFVENNMDINDTLYVSPAGPISIQDVMYGWGKEIEHSGNDFFAHKTGFTESSLIATLIDNGFYQVYTGTGAWEIAAFAFKDEPSPAELAEVGIVIE